MNLQEVDPEHGVDLLVRIGLHRIDAADFEERWLRFGCVNLPFAKHRGRAIRTRERDFACRYDEERRNPNK